MGQTGEVDQLKQKLKQYANYDEIKRELEIMKVSQIALFYLAQSDVSCP